MRLIDHLTQFRSVRRDCLDQLLASSPSVGCRTQLLLGFEQPGADGLQACAHSGVSLINFTEGSSQGRIGGAYLLDPIAAELDAL
ncbi:hypothetical protein RA993_23110, partial [Mycobacteroides abscessus subsp. abscessus]